MPVDMPVLMAECRTKLLTDTPKDLAKSLEFYRDLLSRSLEKSDSENGMCIYQIDKCKEIDAGAILLLMHAGTLLQQRGWKTRISGEGEAMDLVVKHLEHFLRGKKPNIVLDDARSDGDYLLRNIQDRDSMVNEIAEWADLVQNLMSAPEEDVALWQFQISEVTTNGFQHGLREPVAQPRVLVAGKAYPEKKTVQLAVWDNGLSIPATIEQESLKRNVAPKDGNRIRFACRSGVTSKSVPTNQGAGLYSLVETVKQNDGNLLILSRNGLFHATRERETIKNFNLSSVPLPFLQGTLTVVNLRVQ